jgi:hypothetical protein
MLDSFPSRNNIIDDELDGVIAREFHSEYIERLALQNEYNHKFEQRVLEGAADRKCVRGN